MDTESVIRELRSDRTELKELLQSCCSLIEKSEERNEKLFATIQLIADTSDKLRDTYCTHLDSLTKNRDKMARLLSEEKLNREKRVSEIKNKFEEMKAMYETEIQMLKEQVKSYRSSYETLLHLFDIFSTNMAKGNSTNVTLGDIASKNKVL